MDISGGPRFYSILPVVHCPPMISVEVRAGVTNLPDAPPKKNLIILILSGLNI